MSDDPLNILVLAGGPDREREVSLASGTEVTRALRDAGHLVRQQDIAPDDLRPLDRFEAWPGQVVFPVLHGKWGEGGPLQQMLDLRGLPYVGSRSEAAALCMNKFATKQALLARDLPTPHAELLTPGQAPSLQPPAVVKAVDEGSSIGLYICHSDEDIRHACHTLARSYDRILLEQFVPGIELTVGVLELPDDLPPHDAAPDPRLRPLPPIQIVPAADHYDYHAKYERNDTRYLFQIDLPEALLHDARHLAIEACRATGIRHLARVDFLVDPDHRLWILELNTLPGFTTHSLLPMAADHAGLPLPQLTDRLARRALEDARAEAGPAA